MHSLRNVWRAPFRSLNSLILQELKIRYVSYGASDNCARTDSLRNVWRAACQFFWRLDVVHFSAIHPTWPARRCFGQMRSRIRAEAIAFSTCCHRAAPPDLGCTWFVFNKCIACVCGTSWFCNPVLVCCSPMCPAMDFEAGDSMA